jgi:hypothetical protein
MNTRNTKPVTTAKGVETTYDTTGVVYNKYTSEERQSIDSLFGFLMDPRLNLSEIAHRHYSKFNPNRKRSTSRSDLYNKFTYRKAFQPGELENLKKVLLDLSLDLQKVRKIDEFPDVSIVNIGDEYIKKLDPEEYQLALKMVRDLRDKDDDEYILPYYVRTPKPFMVNLSWYEHHVREKKIEELETGVKNLNEVMDILGIPWETAVSEGYTLSHETRDRLYSLMAKNAETMNGKSQAKLIKLLDPANW